MMLRLVIATLQDLSFVIDKADATLGGVSATKLDGYQLRMTVTVRRKSETQLLVRANAQFNITPVEDPEPYQQFFAALQKSVFLAAHTEKPVASSEPLAEKTKAESPVSSVGGTAAAAYESSATTSMAGSSAVPGSAEVKATPETTQGPGEIWIFKIMEGQSPYSADRQVIAIVDNRFSVNVSTNGWRGNISGEIDHLGNLAGTGTIRRMGSTPRTFEFSASQSNGTFRTSIVIAAQSGSVTTITIELARQQL
jgi:hypothetical protein